MTAIEWLMEEITYDYSGGARHNSFIDTVDLSEYFDKAKEMEKQQIIDAFELGTKLEMMVVETVVDNIIKNNLKRNNNGNSSINNL